MANIFSGIPGLQHLMAYWYHFAIKFEALFILTLIDAGTRVGRYILQEFGGKFYAPLKKTNWWPGIIGTSAAIAVAWGYLVYTGNVSTIWPFFGMANQLIGALALSIGTTVLFRMGKAKYSWCTIIPMIFLAVTTLSAGYLNITTNYYPKGNWLLCICSAFMMLLVVVVIADAARQWYKMLKETPTSTPTPVEA
jgi:carbon starvation protein